MGDGSWEWGVADARSGGFLRIERTKQGIGSWEIFTLYPLPLKPKA
jgi:hypothetical protein